MIFLHSSFRVSSTWLWSRFRVSERVVAYCEVFNETLATISRIQAESLRHDTWYSKHPVGAPYFLEYVPLIKDGGGVVGFETSMAFDRFIPAGGLHGTLSEAEESYLRRLSAAAQGSGKIPVLSASRSLGRLRAIKAAFPGLHILIYRNLFQQWCSYTEQFFRNNPYFFNTVRATIQASQHDPFCCRLHELFPLGKPTVDSEDYFLCFVLLHLYLYAQAVDAADLIIDINRLAADEEYRQVVERCIEEVSGVSIDLSGVTDTIAFSLISGSKLTQRLSDITALIGPVVASAPSERGREFVHRALADLRCEALRYAFYAGPLATAAGPGGLLGERDRLRGERDSLVAERDSLVAECERLMTERERLSGEREQLAAKCAALLGSTSWRITAPLRAFKSLLVGAGRGAV